MTDDTAAATADFTRSTKSFDLGVPSSKVFSASLEAPIRSFLLPEVADFSDPEERFVNLSILALAEPAADAADDVPLGSREREVDTILKLFLRKGIDGDTVVLI